MGENYIIINNHLKCCGDGNLDLNDSNDEEYRRYTAINFLKQYIDSNFSDKNVIVVGDWNDILDDNISDNVFQSFLDDGNNYLFADMNIANGTTSDWSYPSWPSHLDHILISNELFEELNNPYSEISTIKIDDFMNSWNQYDNNISDHRPVGIKLTSNNFTSDMELDKNKNKLIKIVDILGREVSENTKGTLFYIYDEGSVEKKVNIELEIY